MSVAEAVPLLPWLDEALATVVHVASGPSSSCLNSSCSSEAHTPPDYVAPATIQFP